MTPDPIRLELYRNLFEAAAEEMGITLQRVAFSANIKERRDFSCAVFDAEGRLLAQAAHIPVHLGSMPASVAAVLEKFGTLRDGDVAILNDPFAGGTHLPDITLVSPVFIPSRGTGEAELIGYVANRAHHADVGGSTPGSMTLSRHIDEEGFRIEPTLFMAGGKIDETFLHRFLSAVRTPAERRGDLDAQLAANFVGAQAVRRMVERNSLAEVRAYGPALLDYSAAFMAKVIAAIPDGVYEFEDMLDDDGAGSGPIPIRARVEIRGERAVVDLSHSAEQVPGCVNCPPAVTRSAVYYCFMCLLDEAVPLSEGCFRNIEVVTRPGSVVHATYPAAVVAGNTETSQRVVDVVFGALARALPGKIPAASCGTMSSVALGAGGWTYYETIGGGCGAGPGWDGTSSIQCHMTNTWNTPAEALELQYPLRVVRFERAQSTGGAGRFTGGDGIFRAVQALENCEGTLLTDRRTSPPYGLAGGGPGAAGANGIVRASGAGETLSGKCRFELRAGDVLTVQTPGGGAWGSASDASDRAPSSRG